MSTIYSTALENYIAGTGSLYAGMNNLNIDIFSGDVPASADAAVDSTVTLLCTINNGGTPGTLNATPTNGVLQKTSTETWTGNIVASGTATFFRAYVPGSGDNPMNADTSLQFHRIQGAVGTDVTSEMTLPSTALVEGNVQQINLWQMQ